VLADATKIGRVTLAQVCRMAEVDVLITDCRATQAQLEALRGQGAAVACV
jgi:DeoR family transcriptional regulator of aga operon